MPQEDVEILSKNDQIEECIMLSLRTVYGINLSDFKARFGYDLLIEKQLQIQRLKDQNLIEIKDENLVCTNKGFHVLNQIILELI